jgi:hypothetical protein
MPDQKLRAPEDEQVAGQKHSRHELPHPGHVRGRGARVSPGWPHTQQTRVAPPLACRGSAHRSRTGPIVHDAAQLADDQIDRNDPPHALLCRLQRQSADSLSDRKLVHHRLPIPIARIHPSVTASNRRGMKIAARVVAESPRAHQPGGIFIPRWLRSRPCESQMPADARSVSSPHTARPPG